MTTSFTANTIKSTSIRSVSKALLVAIFSTGFVFSSLSIADTSAAEQVQSERFERAAKQMESVTPVIDINTATASELSTLINIGLKKAQEIVAYRKAHGEFVSIDELTKVRGIGSNTVEQNRLHMKVAKK